MLSKKLRKCSLPTWPREAAFGSFASSFIAASSWATTSGLSSKSERCVRSWSRAEQTAFAFFVLVRPANWRPKVPSGRPWPPLWAWAICEQTSTVGDSALYQCGLVGCEGTYFLMHLQVDL